MSALYDFSGSGQGTFTFEPVSRFQVIGLNDTVYTTSGATRAVTANVRSVSITITDDASKRELKLEKRDNGPSACLEEDKRKKIVTSVTEARSMAAVAFTYIRNHHTDQLFKDYFGTNSEETVMHYFDILLNADLPANVFCWAPPDVCNKKPLAYFDKNSINYCAAFYDQLGVKFIKDFCKSDYDYAYRGGTTLRMLTITRLSTTDSHIGCTKAKKLPNDKKIGSADNYEVSVQTPSGLPRDRC